MSNIKTSKNFLHLIEEIYLFKIKIKKKNEEPS